ncbi:MAG: biotin/lipoyl-containing protein [Rubricoccaceae bacterium]|nr:biotin/lipoyl-containing protein [Rubricoccaceae bacterium]
MRSAEILYKMDAVNESHKHAIYLQAHKNCRMKLELRLGDRTFTLENSGDEVLLDGTPIQTRFERIGDGTGLLFLNGQTHAISFEADGGQIRITKDGITQQVTVKDETALLLEKFGLNDSSAGADAELHAPMPGLVLDVLVSAGDTVKEGQGLVVLEAMKMENELRAPRSGTVAAVHVKPGEAVGKNALLLELDS